MPCLHPFIAALLVLSWSAATSSSAPVPRPPARTDDNWIVIPAGFMVSYLAVAPGAPARSYRVVVDAPPSASAKRCQPKVTRSCHDEAVDAIAVDYVRALLRMDKKLAANLAGHTLAFQLEVHPYVPVLEPAKPWPSDMRPGEYFEPLPGYPYYSRAHRTGGIGQFRITFGPNGGRPKEVAMLRSTGDEVLDANFLIHALNRWQAPNPTPHQVLVKEVEYRLVLRHAGDTPDFSRSGRDQGTAPGYETLPPVSTGGASPVH